MKKAAMLAGAVLALAAPVAAGASTGNHAPRGNVHVVGDGVRLCNIATLTTWYRYSNGYTWTVTQRLPRGAGEFVLSHDPQGRALPQSVLVHYTPLVCVTDVYR